MSDNVASYYNSRVFRTPAGALFSDDCQHRLLLWRVWDASLPLMQWICLNPSVGGEVLDDPTIVRMCERARRLGYGGIALGNLYALVATNPKVMKASADKIGVENDSALRYFLGCQAGPVYAGWGVHGAGTLREAAVIRMITEEFHRPIHALEITKGGAPKHPLYVSYETQPVPWREAA